MANEWQQRQDTGVFDGAGEFALMFGAGTCPFFG